MKVIIAGSRHYKNEAKVFYAMNKFHKRFEITELLCGLCHGADYIGELWWRSLGNIPIDFPALWEDLSEPDAFIKTNRQGKPYDAKAGFRRNQQMVNVADALITFGTGKGTKDITKRAKKKGIPIYQIDLHIAA